MAKITHTNKAYDPTNKTLTFYTTDPTKRCYSLENFDPENLVHSYTVECTNIRTISENLGKNVDLIKFDIEGMWFDFCEDLFKQNLQVLQINGEFEMNYDSPDLAFDKLNSVVEMFESQGYKTYCNRKLDTWNIELSFIKPEYV